MSDLPVPAADLLNRMDPRSVINLVPDQVQASLIRAHQNASDLMALDERELKKRVRPTPTDNRLRVSFWNEYNRAQETMKPMQMTSVYAGVCTGEFFYREYLRRDENVAWLMRPPVNYITALEEMLVEGQDRIREILELPLVGPSGRPDTKVGELILKTYLAIEARLKGAVAQKIESKSMNINVDGTRAVTKAAELNSMESIQARIAEIERKKAQVMRLNHPHVKDDDSGTGREENLVDAEVVTDDLADGSS